MKSREYDRSQDKKDPFAMLSHSVYVVQIYISKYAKADIS